MSEEFPIFLNENVYYILKRMRNGLIKQIGNNASYNNVVHLLIKEHYKLQNLKKEIDALKKERDDLKNQHNSFLENILLKQTFKQAPVIYPNVPLPTLTPPPKPPQNVSEIKKEYKNLELNGEIKEDLVKELSLLNGKILKPSQVMKISDCKHKKTKIEKKKTYQIRKEKHLEDVKNKRYHRNNKELASKSVVLAKPELFKKEKKI